LLVRKAPRIFAEKERAARELDPYSADRNVHAFNFNAFPKVFGGDENFGYDAEILVKHMVCSGASHFRLKLEAAVVL